MPLQFFSERRLKYPPPMKTRTRLVCKKRFLACANLAPCAFDGTRSGSKAWTLSQYQSNTSITSSSVMQKRMAVDTTMGIRHLLCPTRIPLLALDDRQARIPYMYGQERNRPFIPMIKLGVRCVAAAGVVARDANWAIICKLLIWHIRVTYSLQPKKGAM